MARPKSSDPRQVVTLRLSAAELAAVELAAAAAELERSEYLRRSALDGGRAGGLDRPQRESTEGYRGPPDDIVRTPQGREPVTYELREASALITSHVPGTWSPDPRYPRAVQERDYQHDANEQAKVHRIAGTLDPKHPLALTPTAVDGPPVVTGRGVVLGGNGRTMGLRLAYERGEADAYRRELVERAPAFGLERAAVERMRAPVLVRVVHDLDAASSAELADASARYNEGPGNAMDERARAVSLSRRLSPATLERVAELLELHETLRAAMAAEGRAFVRVLEADGIVTAQNRAAYVTDAGELTEAGKQLLEGAFLGLVAGTPERLSQAAPATLAKLERITPAVARVAARANGHDLVPDVQAALDVLHRAAAQRVTVLELAHQADAFDAPPPARVLELAQDLELLTQKRLAAAARAWAAVADYDPRQPLMFGEHPTPAEAWGRWRSELERKAA